ncbi:MAG: metal/formaldehyde-sensitive transcriptional repressor [Hyphomonadaceae bacterium]|nr:metal/formaldehyde-sensitive transcriptional repressor [Hyphomonadaceae bacterium]
MAHLNSKRDKLIARVRRISGQIAGVERALEADVDCADVLQQVASARGAINGLMDEIIEEHLREHVAKAGLSEKARSQGADELISILRIYSKK